MSEANASEIPDGIEKFTISTNYNTSVYIIQIDSELYTDEPFGIDKITDFERRKVITQSINFRTSENNQDIIDSVIANTAKK